LEQVGRLGSGFAPSGGRAKQFAAIVAALGDETGQTAAQVSGHLQFIFNRLSRVQTLSRLKKEFGNQSPGRKRFFR
jgi:hypothetical protein